MRTSNNLWMVLLAVGVVVGCGWPGMVSAGEETPDDRVIIRAGAARAVIVIPDAPHRTEEYAAGELQKYLERVSGARLEIIRESGQEIDEELGPDRARVLVGNVRAAARLRAMLRRRDADAFLVRVERQQIGYFASGRPGVRWDDRPGTWHDLFLLGATPRATLWAVYDFLEREVGCRWLGPGELWEELPRRETIVLSPGARLEEPSLKYRLGGVLGRGLVDGPGFREDLTDYALKRRANVAKRMNIPLPWAPERARRQLPLPIDVRAWYDEHGGPAIVRAASRDRSEWFAMVDEEGIRSRPQAQWQMCFSNPEVRDLLADRLSRLLRERPELEFVEVGCLDGLSANYCRCEGCAELDIYGDVETSRRGAFTHRWLALVNAVAAGLAESDPDRKLLAAAYGSYQAPPDPAVIVPADNVMISYYTWDGCRLHGYEHETEHDSRLAEMHSHATHREWIDTWLDVTPAGVIMVEYLGRGSMDGITGTNPRRYIRDMAFLHRKGFVGYMPYDYPSTWGFRTLNQYAAARARWDVTLDPDEVLRDFCDHAFRAASADMQRFVQVIQDAMLEAPCSHVTATSWISTETIAAAREHLEAAQAAASGDAIVERRLQTFAMHFQYAELAGAAYNLWYRVIGGERNPELMRTAIEKGRKAMDFRRDMAQRYPRNQHPDLQFGTSASIQRQVQEGGGWHRLLEQLEREQE